MPHLLLLVLLFVGCNGIRRNRDRVPSGQPFDLRVGDAALTTDDLRVRFDTVRSDSRCPMDVTVRVRR